MNTSELIKCQNGHFYQMTQKVQYQYGSVKLVKEDYSWKVISYDF